MSLLELIFYIALVSILLVSLSGIVLFSATLVPSLLSNFSERSDWDIVLRYLHADSVAARSILCDGSTILFKQSGTNNDVAYSVNGGYLQRNNQPIVFASSTMCSHISSALTFHITNRYSTVLWRAPNTGN